MSSIVRPFAALCFALLLVIGLARPATAQDDDEKADQIKKLLTDGIAQLEARKLDDAIATYKKAIGLAGGASLDEDAQKQVLQLAHYNIACGYALKGDKAPALEHLEKALDAGFDDYAHMEKDTDLDTIRKETRFKEIIGKRREAERAKLRAEAAKSISPRPLMDFELDATTIAGEKVRLADLKGKIVVVVFWGTWTKRALTEIPHLIRLREELGATGVEIVGIAYELGKTDDGTLRMLRQYVESKGVKWPNVLVGKDDPLLKRMPQGDQFPSKLFLDREGKVRAAEVGYQPYEALEALVQALAGWKEGPAPEKKPEEKPGDEKKPSDEKKPEDKKPEEKKPEKKPGEDEPI